MSASPDKIEQAFSHGLTTCTCCENNIDRDEAFILGSHINDPCAALCVNCVDKMYHLLVIPNTETIERKTITLEGYIIGKIKPGHKTTHHGVEWEIERVTQTARGAEIALKRELPRANATQQAEASVKK